MGFIGATIQQKKSMIAKFANVDYATVAHDVTLHDTKRREVDRHTEKHKGSEQAAMRRMEERGRHLNQADHSVFEMCSGPYSYHCLHPARTL